MCVALIFIFALMFSRFSFRTLLYIKSSKTLLLTGHKFSYISWSKWIPHLFSFLYNFKQGTLCNVQWTPVTSRFSFLWSWHFAGVSVIWSFHTVYFCHFVPFGRIVYEFKTRAAWYDANMYRFRMRLSCQSLSFLTCKKFFMMWEIPKMKPKPLDCPLCHWCMLKSSFSDLLGFNRLCHKYETAWLTAEPRILVEQVEGVDRNLIPEFQMMSQLKTAALMDILASLVCSRKTSWQDVHLYLCQRSQPAVHIWSLIQLKKVDHEFWSPHVIKSCFFADRKLFRPTWQHRPSCQQGRSWCSPSLAEAVLVTMVPLLNKTFLKISMCFFIHIYLYICIHCLHMTLSSSKTDTISNSLPVQSLGPQQSDGGGNKKRRKRRRKARPEAGGGGGGRREDSGEEFSEDEDMFTIDLSSDEEREGDGSRCVLCVCVTLFHFISCDVVCWLTTASNVIVWDCVCVCFSWHKWACNWFPPTAY